MLCTSCDAERRRLFDEASKRNHKSVSDNVTNGQRKDARDENATVTVSAPASTTVLVENELLSYVDFYRDKVAAENLRKVLVYFYSPSEINVAKKLFISTYLSDLAECSFKTERRKSSSRMLHEIEVEDIIGIADHLDQRSKLHQVKFVAVNFDRVPNYGPEELNVKCMHHC